MSGLIKFEKGFVLRYLSIPIVCLHYDNPFLAMDDEIINELKQYSSMYYSFIWDNKFLEIFKSKNIPNAHKIMLALDDTKFYPIKDIETKKGLCFVGGINSDYGKITTQNAYLDEFIDNVIRAKINSIQIPVLDICKYFYDNIDNYSELESFFNEHEEYFWKEVYYKIHGKGSAFYRSYVLSVIDDVDIYVYGGGNIQKNNVYIRPPVMYGEELSVVYQTHEVNINLSSLQLETSVNNRVFDVFGAKGFVLNDYKEDLKEIFPEHYEAISFKSLEELGEKGDYFLNHPKEREEISEDLYNIIKDKHTYKNRAQYIMETIKKR